VTVVSADYLRGLKDRLTPAAIIPMHTPEEAIAELEFVIRQLGPKVGVFGSNMARKVPAAANDPDTARFCGVVRRVRHRQRLRLRPGLGEIRGTGHRAHLPQRLERMHPDKLDRVKLMSLVEK
jgi:hypothetical protein